MAPKALDITILQVIPQLSTGGAEKTALDVGRAVVARGWQSLIASAGGRMVETVEAEGSRHIELPLASKNPLTIWRNAAHLENVIKEQGVSLIHARSRAPAWSAFLAARRCNIPYVTTYHGAYNEQNALKKLYNSAMIRSDCIIANSGWTRDLIIARSPLVAERIDVIHRGTNFDAFSHKAITAERREHIYKAWGGIKERKIILHLARLTEWKGQRVVIEAAREIVNKHPDVRFVLAGDHQGREHYLQELKDLIAEYGLQEQVILPGHCPDPAAAMAVADVVVVASIEAEAFGRAAVEAAALEKPVIVSRIGAVIETVQSPPEVSENERTGWKVTPNNGAELAQALDDVLNLNDQDKQTITNRARAYGQKHFSEQQMCDKTLSIYERLHA